MHSPDATRVELPILQELEAVGGSDQPRYLYDRLARYFPQWVPDEPPLDPEPDRRRRRLLIQRAGALLVEKGELQRERNRWALTARGRKRLEAETMRITATHRPIETSSRGLSHKDLQRMLVELGQLLGRFAEAEFEYYDVVWRDAPTSPRLSHVFEVQVAGSVDSALTRLKQAYDAQRSQPFLVVADDRSATFAQRRLERSFHEMRGVIRILGGGELEQLYRALSGSSDLLRKIVPRE